MSGLQKGGRAGEKLISLSFIWKGLYINSPAWNKKKDDALCAERLCAKKA
jgi:hypothetical protein